MYLFDPGTQKSAPVAVTVNADLPKVRPHFVSAGGFVANAALSPTGARAVFESRGEIISVPAERGDARNLTNTTGTMERDPAWSPDGRSVAYFSDATGEYTLHIQPQSCVEPRGRSVLGDPPSFYYSPQWSPDGKKISYLDKRLQLWYLDVASGHSVKVDADTYEAPWRAFDPSWSSDSRWIAYSKALPNHLRAIFLYSLESGKATQVTDGLSDARFPAFDAGGEYLYFAYGSKRGADGRGGIDVPISSIIAGHPEVFMFVVLRNDKPLRRSRNCRTRRKPTRRRRQRRKRGYRRRSGSVAAGADSAKRAAGAPIRIDLAHIDQRIMALPTGDRRWSGLIPGASGTMFVLETVPQPSDSADENPTNRETVYKWDLATRKLSKVTEGVSGFGPDGECGDDRSPTSSNTQL